MKKEGSTNFKRVLGEFEQARNELKKLAILNIEAIISISELSHHTEEHKQQWLDAMGGIIELVICARMMEQYTRLSCM